MPGRWTSPEAHMVRRLIAVLAALGVGWVIFMIVAIMWGGGDGFPAIIFLPVVAIIVSSLNVGLALLVGLLLRIPTLKRWWRATPLTAVGVIVVCLLLMCLGSSIGLTQTYTHPEQGFEFQALRADIALIGYFLILFAIANWPFRRRGDDELRAPHRAGTPPVSGGNG